MTALSFRHLFDVDQVTDDDLQEILALAERYRHAFEDGARPIYADMQGRILANIFCEPSTRTRFSFAAAMFRLGGDVLNLEQSGGASFVKGESLEDAGRIMSGYADAIVFRHEEAGSVERFAAFADVPVINGGDGPARHPTQSLTDLFHIKRRKGKFDGLTIAFYGDLRYSRTAFPLANALSRHDCRLVAVAPPGLELPRDKAQALRDKKAEFVETDSLNAVLPELDVLYMTRIQWERIAQEVRKDWREYRLSADALSRAKPDLALMHPLPRIDEIATEIDALPQAGYFEQARGGLYVRMALLALMLGR
ncbi:MAG: aspartate carbamoyltransferase [Rickettsiales bacterium]